MQPCQKRWATPVLFFALLLACGSGDDDPPPPASSTRLDIPAAYVADGSSFSPAISPERLAAAIDHSLFPAPVGATWTYQGETDEGTERVEVEVLAETRDVWGVAARVVRDTVFLDGEMIEDTWDWFAQDDAGNVWYLGEETYEYEDGEVACSCGAWESGVDGALPGVVMLSDPEPGDAYRQEFYAGEAEDLAAVVSLDESVSVPAGSWSGCLKTRERSVIDPDADELKYYCPGVGLVLEQTEDERVELVSTSLE